MVILTAIESKGGGRGKQLDRIGAVEKVLKSFPLCNQGQQWQGKSKSKAAPTGTDRQVQSRVGSSKSIAGNGSAVKVRKKRGTPAN